MFFIDANVFLELLLGQERADEREGFLRLVHVVLAADGSRATPVGEVGCALWHPRL